MADPAFGTALTVHADGLLLALQVTPGANEDRFPDGFGPWRRRLGIRVTAPPVDGQANRAVCTTLAAFFEAPTHQVHLHAGRTGTQKTVRLEGMDRDAAVRRLSTALPA